MLELDKIYCTDCRVGMRKLPDESVDLVVTSPPYNAGTTAGSTDSMYEKYGDDMHQRFYFEFINECLDEMLRVSKRYVFLNIAELGSNKWAFHQLIGSNNYLKQILIWYKRHSMPSINPYCLTCNFEFILVYDKIQPALMSFKDVHFGHRGNNTTAWEGPPNRDFHCDENHAIFPMWLPRKVIELFSKPGHIVLDPFMGVGTTAVVAKQLDRRFIGFELDQKQVDIANKRLEQKSLWRFGGECNENGASDSGAHSAVSGQDGEQQG